MIRLFGFPLLLLLAFFVFKGALSGPFVLDDQRIYSFGGAVLGEPLAHHFSSLANLFDFVISRPLSMVSFYVEDVGWPTQPYRFKLDNLLLHLINAGLLFLLVYRLFSGSTLNRRWLIAFVAAGLWLLHPMQLSTMMTVVQRMTLLMASFVLLGMLLYVWGRASRGRVWLRYVLMSTAVVGMGGLAVLCKPNGALLVFLILATEVTLLSAEPRPPGFKAWVTVFLLVPASLILIVLVTRAEAGPDYGILARLFTEARVLWDYLGNILLPRVTDLGLYHDDFSISESLFTPPSTLFAVSGVLLILVVAVWSRRRVPLFAFAVLWFLSGQLIESTVLPLEIYFEHRNYVAMIGICIAVAALLVKFADRFKYWLAAALVLALASMSMSYSVVWGNADLMALTWAQNKPQSARAQIHLANQLWLDGEHEQALDVLYQSWNRLPTHIYLVAKALELECSLGRPVTIDLQPVITAAVHGLWTQPLGASLVTIGEQVRSGHCPVVDADDLDRLLAAVLESQSARNRPYFGFYLWMERVFLSEARGDVNRAWSYALTAKGLWTNPYVLLHLSRLALRKGSQQDALRYWSLAEQELEQDAGALDGLQELLKEQAAGMVAAGLIGSLQK